MDRHFAVIALVGPTNSGKSTLVNRLVGTKVSIVSPKVQTTRNRVLGIAIKDITQLVFVDTPGIFEPKKRLQRAMVESAWVSAKDADQVVFLLDSSIGITDTTEETLSILQQRNIQVTIALNKTDLIHPTRLLKLAEFFASKKVCLDIFMISGLTGDGVSDLVDSIVARAPPGVWLYPEDQVSDISLKNLVAEITRERLFLQLQQELPYACMVETNVCKTLRNKSIRIEQTIYVQKRSHKLIVVGEAGKRVKSIGQAAREEIQNVLSTVVHLFIRVKIDKNWEERREIFETLGLRYDV